MTEKYLMWKGWESSDFGLFTSEEATQYEVELLACGIRSVRGLKVGELGFGNGAFAGWVRKEGGDWVGREAIAALQEKAVEAGFKSIGSESTFSGAFGPGELDLVVAFDVLEHLDLTGIRSFLAEAREALKPGGLLLARLPSGDSPFSGSIFFGDISHRTLLGSGAVRQLAMEFEMDALQIRPPKLPIRGFGFVRALRRMIVVSARAIIHPFVRKILMGQDHAVIDPNMIIVVGKRIYTLPPR